MIRTIKEYDRKEWKILLDSKETMIPMFRNNDVVWIHKMLGWEEHGKRHTKAT